MVANGLDPMVEKDHRKLRAHFDANNMFHAIAEEWFVKITRQERVEITLSKIR